MRGGNVAIGIDAGRSPRRERRPVRRSRAADASGEQVTAIIERIAPAVRLEEKVKVFDVEIAIDRQGAELRTGMTANIDVIGEKREGVLTVPVEAIFKEDDYRAVIGAMRTELAKAGR